MQWGFLRKNFELVSQARLLLSTRFAPREALITGQGPPKRCCGWGIATTGRYDLALAKPGHEASLACQSGQSFVKGPTMVHSGRH
jgi:hypothetical protein